MEAEKKKTIISLIIVLLALIFGLLAYFLLGAPNKPSPNELRNELLTQQRKELEALRKNYKPPTQKELEKQRKELDALRKNSKPPTEEELKKQQEELNKLRPKSQ